MQLRIPGYVLFSIASFLLLVHNLTPHLHHSEISEFENEKQHQSGDDLIDWLYLSFHHSPDVGHLEFFSAYAHFDQDLNAQVFLTQSFLNTESLFYPFFKPGIASCISTDLKKHSSLSLLVDSPLRAPPIFS